MKKYITALIFLLVSFVFLHAVWEGNGIAGVATDFKEDGMFVKSSLFPKYTLVEILNLENNIKVRSIVLEGSQSPGILMSFSPSVAQALKVPYGQVARIRVVSPSVVSEGDDLSVNDEKATTSFEIEDEPSVEKPTPVLVAEEKTLPTENKEDKKDDNLLGKDDEVLLYDFKPISKTVEKKGKDEGAISFDPAFIEEDISLNLNIPEKSLDNESPKVEEKVENKKDVKREEIKKIEPIEEKPIEKKEEVAPIPPKDPSMAPKIEKKTVESPATVTPPKEVTTVVKHDIYLETAAPRPPKDVPTPKMEKKEEKPQIEDVMSVGKIEAKKKEERIEKIEDVQDVLTIEKKEEPKKDAILIVDEVPQIDVAKKTQSKVEEDGISDVIILKEGGKKEVKQNEEVAEETEENVEDVQNAPPIKEEKEEEKKENTAPVEEVITPFQAMNKTENDEKVEGVKEIDKVKEKEDTKECTSIEPVQIVDKPKKQENEKAKEVADVPTVPAIKEKVIEEAPVEESAEKIEEEVVETEPQEDDVVEKSVDEQPQEEEMEEEIEEEKPIENAIESPDSEEIVEEPIEQTTQQINERPLKEIEVHNTAQNRIEVDASKEDVELEENKNISAIENYDVGRNNAPSNISESERALDEVEVLPKQEQKEARKEESLEEKATEEPSVQERKKNMEDPIIEESEEIENVGEKENVEKEDIVTPIVEKREKIEEIKKEEAKRPSVESKKEKTIEDSESNERFPIGKTISGYTYVQIAVYNSAIYVEDVLKKYGSRYPVIIEKKGKNRYVVFIGPLQKHEAGAIQELFKGFGFSGCFVR